MNKVIQHQTLEHRESLVLENANLGILKVKVKSNIHVNLLELVGKNAFFNFLKLLKLKKISCPYFFIFDFWAEI